MKDPIRKSVRSHASLTRSQLRSRFRRLAHAGPRRGRVAMFHVGRSGSTVLARMLARHSHVRWGDELFYDVESKTPDFRPTRRWVRSVIEGAAYAGRCGYFGFETKATQFGPHCIRMSVEDYVSLLQGSGFRHFIVLTRDNLLRVIVSGMVGMQRGEWHADSATSVPTRVTIDPDRPWGTWAGSLTEILDYYLNFYREFDVPLAHSRRLDLNYEKDIESDPAVGYLKICRFLDIEPERSDVPLRPTNPFSIEDMIVNYEEIADALRGTRFEWMLTA